MAVYYLIRGNTIEQEIDTDDEAVIALPLLGGAAAASLLNRSHVIAILNRTGWTVAEFVDYFGLIDERST